MKVLVVEDSALFREGLAALLVSAGHVVGTAPDGGDVPAVVARDRPDLVLLDVRMPPTYTDEGARLAGALKDRFAGQPVLLLSQQIETRHSATLLSRGGFGYLLKDRVLDVDDFLAAMEQVARGGTVVDPEVVARLVNLARSRSRLEALTPRELEVLGLIAEGRTNAKIARRLFLTDRTVETHVSSILTKLDLDESSGNRRVLAVLAYLEAARGSGPCAHRSGGVPSPADE